MPRRVSARRWQVELNARSPNRRIISEAPRQRPPNEAMDSELASVMARRKQATPGRDAAAAPDELAAAWSKRQTIY